MLVVKAPRCICSEEPMVQFDEHQWICTECGSVWTEAPATRKDREAIRSFSVYRKEEPAWSDPCHGLQS